MAFPAGPMPHGQGPFEDVPMGQPLEPILVHDFHQNNYGPHRGGSPEPWNDGDFDERPRNKNKKNGQYQSSVDVRYEGYILEKLDPRRGETGTTWARVGKRAMPFNDKKLEDIVKAHRLRTRQSPQHDFKQLTSNQQGTINRLIAERKRHENNPNADWILADVQRSGDWTWTSMKVKKIQVIIKREDKYYSKEKDKEKGKEKGKDKNSTNHRESKSYQYTEIIDLDDPLMRKDHNISRHDWNDNEFVAIDDRGAGGGAGGGKKKKSKKKAQNRNDDDYNGFDNRGGGGGNDFPPPLGPPMNHQFPQPIPIPIHEQFNGPMHAPGQMQPPPPFEPQGHPQFPPAPPPPPARHPSARQQQQPIFTNPFEPHPQFAVHDPYDSPPIDTEDFAHRPNGDGERRRSQSIRRRSSTRRPSISTRQFSELVDRVNDLHFQLNDIQGSSGSSNDSIEGDSVFSRPQDGRDYHNSAPTSVFSRGSLSLERTQSYDRPRHRSRRYKDAHMDMEPGYTYRNERQYSPELHRRRSTRPSVHHSQSYDDYPMGKAARPRYLPAPPGRLGDFDEQYDYENYGRHSDDHRDVRPSHRRAQASYDSYLDDYDRPRREFGGGGGRRRSSVGRPRWD